MPATHIMVRPSLPLKSIAGAGRVPFGWQKPRQWILFGRWFAQKSAKEASLIVPEERDFIAYTQARKEAVENLKKNSQTDPYPHKYHTTHSIGDLVREFDEKCGGISAFSSDIRVSFGGRVERIRKAGAHLLFLDVRADGHKLQVIFDASQFEGQTDLEHLKLHLKRGDIVGITGNPGRSKTAEFSVRAISAKLLSPCLHMLPDSHFGLVNPDTRYRNRHLDLLVNATTRDIFKKRAKIISILRTDLSNREFLEVETPSLNLIPGGASAKPFWTHHNDLKRNMSLRISPELFLKSLVVGGFDRVFEIGKNFRNEQIDPTHNPEFTSCEAYGAYLDYEDMMAFTEEVLGNIVRQVNEGSLLFQTTGNKGEELTIDFTAPFKRIDLKTELEHRLQSQLPTDLTSEEANTFFNSHCQRLGVECPEPRTTARLIDKLIGSLIEVECRNPTFLVHFPQLTSPLAKEHRAIPGWTERFELFIQEKEFVNAYTELNDPQKQAEQFKIQAIEKEKGNDEACPVDEGFVRTLEYGLPPTAGWGLGIDRLVMLLTRSKNLQEVILFPTMRPIKSDKVQ